MEANKIKSSHSGTGDQLWKLVKFGSFGGLFFALIGTGLVWAGTDSFNCSTIVWKTSLALNLITFALTWIIYIPFRNTDLLLGNGLLMITTLVNMFSTFWFGGFYFYFIFAPLNEHLRAAALVGITSILFYRAYQISRDMIGVFQKNKRLLTSMYCDEGISITFKREAINLLEKSRKQRRSFSAMHVYAAILVVPFVFVLNKLFTPLLGDGHGVFLILAFFSVPMMLWGIEVFMQTVTLMIFYPIKLWRKTGKTTVLKDWR
jgi:hypothetical protein